MNTGMRIQVHVQLCARLQGSQSLAHCVEHYNGSGESTDVTFDVRIFTNYFTALNARPDGEQSFNKV